jgi:hypothetical protein
MKRYRSPKSLNIKKHFAKRCMERVGVLLDSKRISKMIQNGELEFVRRTSNTKTVFKYICPTNGQPYKVVYDKNNHDIVTIYPYYSIKRNCMLKK